jgi:hypothetical protein
MNIMRKFKLRAMMFYCSILISQVLCVFNYKTNLKLSIFDQFAFSKSLFCKLKGIKTLGINSIYIYIKETDEPRVSRVQTNYLLNAALPCWSSFSYFIIKLLNIDISSLLSGFSCKCLHKTIHAEKRWMIMLCCFWMILLSLNDFVSAEGRFVFSLTSCTIYREGLNSLVILKLQN